MKKLLLLLLAMVAFSATADAQGFLKKLKDKALEKAKAQLGLKDTDEYDFEVIQREEKKRFGLFGGRPAKVRAFVIIQESAEDKTEKFLREVLDKMGLAEIAIEKKQEEDTLEFNLSGEEEGFVIGRRG